MELRAIVDLTLLRSLDHPLFSTKKKKCSFIIKVRVDIIIIREAVNYGISIVMLVNRRSIRQIYNGSTPLCIIVDLTLLRSLHSFSLKKKFSYRQNARMT